MTAYFRGPLTYTWLVLTAATLVSWWLGALAPVLALLIAVMKCRIVMWNYMDVRLAPSWLRMTCDAWLVLTFGMTSSVYWLVV